MAVFSVLLVTIPPFGAAGDPGSAFLKIDGREAVLRSVELFLNRDAIKQIQLAVTPEMLEETKRRHGGHLGFSGVKLLAAGPRFVDQMAAATERLAADCTHVLIHDATRPAVPYSDIDAMLEPATGKSTALALPLRNALVQLDEGNSPVGFVPEASYMQVATPLVIPRAKFVELAKARREIHASDLTLIKGSPLNVRLASGADAPMVKAMLGMLPKAKSKAASSPFEEAQW